MNCKTYCGFPPPHRTAPPNRRYVGLYYYESYWLRWAKVLAVSPEDGTFTVQTCDLNGDVLEDAKVRTHRTPMWACHFADKPFDVWLAQKEQRYESRY